MIKLLAFALVVTLALGLFVKNLSKFVKIAALGRGRFYDVQNPSQLPQIFIKEAAVILKSAIFEEPFVPQLIAPSEIVRGMDTFPQLLGYVCTTPKARAEVPLVSDKGDGSVDVYTDLWMPNRQAIWDEFIDGAGERIHFGMLELHRRLRPVRDIRLAGDLGQGLDAGGHIALAGRRGWAVLAAIGAEWACSQRE